MAINKNQRKSKRIPGHIRIGYGETKVCVSDITENISQNGLFIRTPYPLEVGTHLKIELHYQTNKKANNTSTLKLEGRVAHIRKDSELEGMGIVFLNLSDENNIELQKIMDRLSKEMVS